MRIAICDDEKAQQKLLQKYITEWAGKQKTKASFCLFDDAEKFLFAWETDKVFDLLVLDIEMGEMNGIELASKLRQSKADIPILFVTGYDQYMQKGYDVEALHYLLKPLDKDRLFAVLDRLQRNGRAEEKILFTSPEEGPRAFFPSKIWYVEADGHFSILVTENDRYRIRESISTAGTLLCGQPEFSFCHRSYLVNMTHVAAVTKTEVTLDDGRKIPLSRSMAKSVHMAFVRRYTG